MAKKHKQTQHVSLPELRARVERANREGRHQQGLELARSLFQREPTDQHRDLVKSTTLLRARQLRTQGYARDAYTALENAVKLDPGQAWLEQLAAEMALCGRPAEALRLLNQVPDSPARAAILGHAADAALAQGPQGRALLATDLQPHFDLIVKAFAHLEAGQDEEAKAALQGIGLQSPFLEWKLLARGLAAYYQNDDVRAIENWQRLSADRVPARLAAPLRFRIDAAYRAAQPPPTQNVLQQQSDRLQGSTLVQSLRGVQKAVANERQLPDAFRQAEKIVPNLQRDAPQLVPRLAASFYWAVIDHGMPEDMGRYRRVFGPPHDDPKLARLEALALERRGAMDPAHKSWLVFEQSIADNRAAWPGDQADRVRALVWHHMGLNAVHVPDIEDLKTLPPFLRDHPDRPRPLKPTAEECFEKSIALAPDQLESYVELMNHYLHKAKPAPVKAEKVARRLLAKFPDHVPTLEKLGDLRQEKQDYTEALTLFQQALKSNPLERRLRAKVSNAHAYHARQLAEAGRFDEARQEYQATLRFDDVGDSASILCKWAAVEFKAGQNDRAEELVQQAYTRAGHPLPVAMFMLIETIRFKLARPLKTRFDKEFKEQLKAPPDAKAAAAMASMLASLRGAGVTYTGQKTHEKSVTTYLERASALTFPEQDLLEVCGALLQFGSVRLFNKYTDRGQVLYPRNPLFWLLPAEQMLERHEGRGQYQARQLLKHAREKATALPPDDRRQMMLDRIEELEEQLRMMNPFAALFDGMAGGGFMDPFFGDPDDDYEDDEVFYH